MNEKSLYSCEETLSLDSLIARRQGVVLADTIDPVQNEVRYRSLIEGLLENRQIVLNIEVTAACNLQCIFCSMHSFDLDKNSAQTKGRKQKAIKTISLKAFQDIIQKCAGLPPLKVLYLVGHGEPLLHPHLPDMVKVAREAAIAERIIITSNGVLLVPQLLRQLVTSGLDEIRISLDLFSPEMYRKVKGRDYALTVRRNIEDCLEVIRSEALPVDMKIECLNWRSPDPALQMETYNIIDYFGDQIAVVPGASIRVRNEFGWINQMGFGEGSHQVRMVPCEQLFFQLLVHADGDISPCCLDSSKTYTLGNIFAVDSLREIMNSPVLNNFRKKMLLQDYEGIEPCHACNFSSSVDQLLLERRQEVLRAMEESRKNDPVN